MRIIAICLALALGGCSGFMTKFTAFQTNFGVVIAGINADIAAVAPIVAKDCGDLQTAAMLIAPYVPNSGNAQKYFAAANGALTAYCQVVPTDIASTANAVFSAVKAAQAGYDSVSAGGK